MNSVCTDALRAPKPITRLSKGFWSLADQGGVSLGNFLSNWLLARNLARVDYGIFALLFGLLLVGISIHSSLIALPLSVYGAEHSERDRKELHGYALLFSVILGVPMALVCVGACIYLQRTALSPVVAAAMFLWFVQETMRRALMAELRYREALWGDVISYLGQVLLLFIVIRQGILSLSATFLVMGATSAVAAILQVLQAGVGLPKLENLVTVARRFTSLGVWPLLGSLTSVLTFQVFPWTLAIARGPAQTAIYQTGGNLLALSHPLLLSIGNLIVPTSARAMAEKGINAAKAIAIRYGMQGALLLAPYYLILFLFPTQALRLLYGASSPYVGFDYGVRTLVITYSLMYGSQVLSSLFNGIARSKLSFMASIGGVVVALLVAIPMIALTGITGALIASCLVCGARCLLCVYYYRTAI